MKCRFALLILIATVLGLSCQKTQDSPTPVQIDSLKAALPKQIIETFTDNSSGQPITNTYVVSIKDDTVNRTIELSMGTIQLIQILMMCWRPHISITAVAILPASSKAVLTTVREPLLTLVLQSTEEPII